MHLRTVLARMKHGTSRALLLVNLALVGVSTASVWSASGRRPPVGMVEVPAGSFPSALARATLSLPAFYIDVDEVTIASYDAFVRASGYKAQGTWQRYAEHASPSHPVVGVTLDDAAAYATWHGKRLPEAVEWERACRGSDGRTYPWGKAWVPGKANVNTQALAPVGSFPGDVSPYGVRDLAGNAFEWTMTPTSNGPEYRAVMGSGWQFEPRGADLTIGIRKDTPSQLIGFRCVWPRRR